MEFAIKIESGYYAGDAKPQVLGIDNAGVEGCASESKASRCITISSARRVMTRSDSRRDVMASASRLGCWMAGKNCVWATTR
jgi:hypothetical protein